MGNCNLCKHDKENEEYGACYNCENGSEFVRMTNADRIRSMTDEELAEFIFSQIQSKCSNHDCVGADFCYYHEDWNGECGSGCEHAIIKWLQKDSEV